MGLSARHSRPAGRNRAPVVAAVLFLLGSVPCFAEGDSLLFPTWPDSFPGFVFKVNAADAPNDQGGTMNLEWPVFPLDSGNPERFFGYRVFRATNRQGPWDSIGWTRPGGPQDSVFSVTTGYSDSTRDGQAYFYQVRAYGPDGSRMSAIAGPAKSSAQWFHAGRVNFLVIGLLFSALLILFIERAKKTKMFVRRLAGLDAIEDAVGRATEMGRPILFSFGLSVINDVTTLAALSVFGKVARKCAEYSTKLLSPHEDPMVMTAARETAKQAYTEAGRPDLFDENAISFLTSDQFGYAAGVDGMVLREKPGAVFWQGYFYAEALILAETGHSVGAIQIAGTTSIEQLPFFVVACDYTLIGEEMFAASSYLNPEPQMMGSLKGEDALKAIIMVVIGILAVLGTIGVILSTGKGPSGISRLFDTIVNWFTQV
jgi:hypothetical protein